MAAARFDTLRSIAFGSITNSYTNFGSALTHSWRLFKISNNTDGDMLFSLDGTNDNMFVPAYGFTLYDLATNSQPVHNSDNLQIPLQTQFKIKYSTAPTEGDVYLEGIYAGGE